MIIVSQSDYDSATSRQKIELECECCHKHFFRLRKDIIDSMRDNSHRQVNYCSRKCLMISRKKHIKTTCGFCGKEIEVVSSVISKSKSGLVFCSVSCGVKYNNSHNSSDKYEKISNTLKIKLEKNSRHKICKHCGNSFKETNKRHFFCSVKCCIEYAHDHKKPKVQKTYKPKIYKPRIKIERTKEWCKETVISLRSSGIIPTVRTMPILTHASKNLFGGWNKMMMELGYTDIFVGTKRKLKSKDGHRCDSAS